MELRIFGKYIKDPFRNNLFSWNWFFFSESTIEKKKVKKLVEYYNKTYK